MDRPQKCSNEFASKAVLYQGLARFCRQRIPFVKCFTTCQTWVKKIENTSPLPLFRKVALSIQIFLTTLSAPWQKQAFGIFNRHERISKQTFHAITRKSLNMRWPLEGSAASHEHHSLAFSPAFKFTHVCKKILPAFALQAPKLGAKNGNKPRTTSAYPLGSNKASW